MSTPVPQVFVSCPCADSSNAPPKLRTFDSSHEQNKRPGSQTLAGSAIDFTAPGQFPSTIEENDSTASFDPRSPIANYTLYPPEHLLYCEDCQQIRCPKCVIDEIVCWFCPSCLFEVPGGSVKSDGNRQVSMLRRRANKLRCMRNCYLCPICQAPMTVNSTQSPDATSADSAAAGPWTLNCGYCLWSSSEVGIEFDKPNNITAQLTGAKRKTSLFSKTTEQAANSAVAPAYSAEEHFASLKKFYVTQVQENANTGSDLGSSLNLGSPGNLTRIMGLYGSLNSNLKPKSSGKQPHFREAQDEKEGLHVQKSDSYALALAQKSKWNDSASREQRSYQLPGTRYLSELRPIPVLLRVKKAKRCRTCRHILVKPEPKINTIRFKIRLVALNYIPTITISPLPTVPRTPLKTITLKSAQTSQFLLGFQNALYEPIKMTLATPSITPGKVRSKVTILCPQMTIGANGDAWDEALGMATEPKRGHAAAGSLSLDDPLSKSTNGSEAGKVYERGKNWVKVIVEVVPGILNDDELYENDDILEIPILVRTEWEAEAGDPSSGRASALSTDRGDKERSKDRVLEKRELEYWVVLSVGRIEKQS